MFMWSYFSKQNYIFYQILKRESCVTSQVAGKQIQMEIRVQEVYQEVLSALPPIRERKETGLDRGRNKQSKQSPWPNLPWWIFCQILQNKHDQYGKCHAFSIFKIQKRAWQTLLVSSQHPSHCELLLFSFQLCNLQGRCHVLTDSATLLLLIVPELST